MYNTQKIKIIKQEKLALSGVEQTLTLLFIGNCDSTQKVARSLLYRKEYFGATIAVCAGCQKQGRGRFDRRFISPKGAGVYLTAAFPYQNEALSPILSGVVALSVIDTINNITGLSATIKWPNDVCINGLKVAGILPESVIIKANNNSKNNDFLPKKLQKTEQKSPPNNNFLSQEDEEIRSNLYLRYYLLGVGINVNTLSRQLKELPNATSLYMCTGQKFDIHSIATTLCQNLLGYFDTLASNKEELVKRYVTHCDSIGKTINFDIAAKDGAEVTKSGVIQSINEDLSINVLCADGLTIINWGEVTWQ